MEIKIDELLTLKLQNIQLKRNNLAMQDSLLLNEYNSILTKIAQENKINIEDMLSIDFENNIIKVKDKQENG